MAFEARLLLACGLFSTVVYSRSMHVSPFGHSLNCPGGEGVYRFEVGSGWDNLRNLHMGVVTLSNYSKCKTSDGGKFLIPDNVFLYPVMASTVEKVAEFFDHWTNYSSTTSRSINAGASVSIGFGSVSGSFSSEFESVKKHQVQDKYFTTRVQMRYVQYLARLQPDSALKPEFKSRLLEIASHLQHNNIVHANFLAQILVRDFGTHYITSVDIGAVLAKVDHLTREFVANFQEDMTQIMAIAGVSFYGAFGFKLGYSQVTDNQILDQYTKNTIDSTKFAIGEPLLGVNLTIDQWKDRQPEELGATIDRSGDPLHYAITPGSLPELSEGLTYELANVVEQAIKQYYKHNTIKGCTKIYSPNFSFQANLDDGSCESPSNNYTFGGVYQTCQSEDSPAGDPCGPLLQKNPLTSDFKCSDGYEAVLVHQGRTPQSCHRDCHGWWVFKSCKDNCGYASYSSYWCVAEGQVPANTGYLFGGLYSETSENPVTQGHSCPLKFYPLRFGATMQVCVSDDYELGYQQSVPFGGFFSCNAGNPLARGHSNLEMFANQSISSGWPKTCPTGYSLASGGCGAGLRDICLCEID
ncbi:hypothetical protein ACROYT_G001529 [Oculina patagonica]